MPLPVSARSSALLSTLDANPRAPRRNSRTRRLVLASAWAVAIAVVVFAASVRLLGGSDAPPTYIAADPTLRTAGIYLYAASPTACAPRAIVLFFGNDVGFWNPHRRMAASLAQDGYAVAGVDIRPLFDGLSDDTTARAATLRARIASLEQRIYAELAPHAPNAFVDVDQCVKAMTTRVSATSHPTVPLILAGHSLGAELALWSAAHVDLPRLRGVMAISPGTRSHLRIASSDLLMTDEPTEPGSFSVASQIAAVANLHKKIRIAIVRGMRDGLRSADPVLVAAGGDATRRFEVPFVGHSMKQVVVAIPVVSHALSWLANDF